jgi:hypothetical protein
VSVSIGSDKRDHQAEVELLGEKILIERRGTNGDIKKAIDLIKELDGKVDAFGMGGIDLYLVCAGRRYLLRDAKKILLAAENTPIVDGSGLKNTLERRIIAQLAENILDFKGKNVLVTAGVDRFGMAEALEETQCNLILGDLIFALGIPIPIRSVSSLANVARVLAPIISQLPFSLIYPTGERQEQNTPKHEKFFKWADIIAGDFLFIKRYMPANLKGKILITNTTTARDLDDLKKRGLRMLITTTPELNGRSFGTNVMEAALVALSGKKELNSSEYLDLLEKLQFAPRVVNFS